MIVHEDRFHYGWLVVGVSTLVLIGSYGTELSFGVFLKPLLQEFGWTRTMVSGAMSIVTGVAGPVGILTGRITDKYGARFLIAIGGLFAISGYIVMFKANSLWQLYLFFGVFLGVSISSCWAPLIATVSRWFTQKRVLAIGILTSGLNIGSMLVPPIIAYYIDAHGWRISFLILAGIIFVTTTPALFMLGRRPDQNPNAAHYYAGSEKNVTIEQGRSSETDEWSAVEAVKTLPFSMVLAIGFITATGFFFVAVHMVPYATDMGIKATAAALILSFLSLANIIGKLLAWPITRKMGSRLTLLIFVGLQAFALFSLIRANTLWMLFFLGAIFGFGLGGSMAIRMSIIPEFFGTKAVGTLIGIAGNAWGLGGIVGPIFAGYIFDISHSYDLAFITGGSLLVLGMIASIILRAPRPRS